MSSRLDDRIRALVVELVSDPVEPPPFPTEQVAATPAPGGSRRFWPAWSIGVAAFVAVLSIGVVAVLLSRSPEQTPPETASPREVVDTLVNAINAGDLDTAISLFAEDAQCVAPGLPTCGDLLGFFVAAEGQVTFESCAVDIEPYLQCWGYLHTSIHDALGISSERLALQPNFPPAFIVEGGLVVQFNFNTPFTGDEALDGELWSYLQSNGADYLNENGVPSFSADIVPRLLEDAREFTAETGS